MLRCPICGMFDLSPLLAEVLITAKFPKDDRSVGGFVLYTCNIGSHIFMVRAAEVAALQDPPALRSGTAA